MCLSLGHRVATLLVLSLVACGDREPQHAAVGLVSLEPQARDAALEALEFRATRSVAWLDDRTVMVIDRDDQQLVALDLSSGSARRAARRGEGPGELTGAISLLAGEPGLLVMDMNLRRLSEFGSALEFVRSHPIPGFPAALVGWSDDSATVLWMDFGPGGPKPRLGQIDLASGAIRERIALYEINGGFDAPATANPFAPVFFSGVAAASGEWLLGQGSEYRIVAFDGDRAVGSFGRDDLPQQFLRDEEQAAARERRRRAGGRFGEPPPGLRDLQEQALEGPENYFGPNAFSLDDEGRLWVVTTRNRGDSTEVDIFDAERAFLQVVALRDRVQALAFRYSRLVVLVERASGGFEGFSGIDLYEIGS